MSAHGRFAEIFHLPIVYLMDCPGFMIGLEAEKAATIRHGVRAMAAVNQTTVPWCTVIVRNSFGVAGVVHQPADRFSIRYAWPSAYWGFAAARGWYRSGLSRRDRCGARSVLGPWIVTPDEIGDPYRLKMEARVNGEVRSQSTSEGMLFSFEEIIAHISRDETLMPGETTVRCKNAGSHSSDFPVAHSYWRGFHLRSN